MQSALVELLSLRTFTKSPEMQMEPRALMGSCWNFLLWSVPSTHEIQKYVSRRIADDQMINQFFSWTTFAGFVFQGGHIFVHSFIGLFIISLTVQIVQPCPLEVTILFESNISRPVSLNFATFRPLLPFTRSTGFTTGT